MGKIILENISLFGFHGCMEEEAKVGTFFTVDLEVEADLSRAAMTDELSQAVDYVHLHNIVREEMAIPSKLLENVTNRIIQRIKKELIAVHYVKVKVCKLCPPLCGEVRRVCVIMKDKG